MASSQSSNDRSPRTRREPIIDCLTARRTKQNINYRKGARADKALADFNEIYVVLPVAAGHWTRQSHTSRRAPKL